MSNTIQHETFFQTNGDIEVDVILRTGYAGLGESDYVVTTRLRGEYPYNPNPQNYEFEKEEEARNFFNKKCEEQKQLEMVAY